MSFSERSRLPVSQSSVETVVWFCWDLWGNVCCSGDAAVASLQQQLEEGRGVLDHVRKGVCRAPGVAETPEGVPRQVGSDTRRAQREMEAGRLKVARSFHVCAFWFCSNESLDSKGKSGRSQCTCANQRNVFPLERLSPLTSGRLKGAVPFLMESVWERGLSLESRAGMFYRIYSHYFLAWICFSCFWGLFTSHGDCCTIMKCMSLENFAVDVLKWFVWFLYFLSIALNFLRTVLLFLNVLAEEMCLLCEELGGAHSVAQRRWAA